jgi:CheY-like chemotaxis protein
MARSLQAAEKDKGNGAGPGDHAHREDQRAGPVVGLELGADDYVTKPFTPASWCCGEDILRRMMTTQETEDLLKSRT